MKKSLPHTVLSTVHRCHYRGCEKGIKQRLVNIRKVTPKLCFKHWKELRCAHNVESHGG